MAQRNQRGMTTVRAPVFRLERLNLTVPSGVFAGLNSRARPPRRDRPPCGRVRGSAARARRDGIRRSCGRSAAQSCSPATGAAYRVGCRGLRRCRAPAAGRARWKRGDPPCRDAPARSTPVRPARFRRSGRHTSPPPYRRSRRRRRDHASQRSCPCQVRAAAGGAGSAPAPAPWRRVLSSARPPAAKRGSHDNAIAIIARWRRPPDNSCG